MKRQSFSLSPPTPIPFSSLSVGTYVCYQTGEGRPGEFRVNTVTPTTYTTIYTIGYTTWTQ